MYSHAMPSQIDARITPDTRNLEPQVAQSHLKELHRRDARWTWVCALYPLAWIASALLMYRFPLWPIRAAGIVLIGISIQAMAILMHEALHRNLFRNRPWDRWAAFALGVPAFFSGTAYAVIHLNHHRHTRRPQDQDEIANRCRTTKQFHILLYVRYLFGTLLYFLVVPMKALALATPDLRRRITGEYAAMFGIYVALIVTSVAAGHGEWLVWYWLLPVGIAILLSNVRGNAEHIGTGMDGVMTRSRTITSNPLVSFLMCNLNYHLEHHLYPGIPWYNLPRAHRLLRASYAKAEAHVERSYIRYTIKALCGAVAITSH